MAVTLYRCQKCRGLFNAVFEPNKWCRDCKLNQASGGTSKGSLETLSGVSDAKELTIIEPEESMDGSKSSAIGGPIGDAQNVFAQQQAQQYQQELQNATGLAGLLGAAGQQGVFSGGAEIQSPFTYETPGYKFKFSGWNESAGNPAPLLDPKPESSPHESILKPSRKLKFAAE